MNLGLHPVGMASPPSPIEKKIGDTEDGVLTRLCIS